MWPKTVGPIGTKFGHYLKQMGPFCLQTHARTHARHAVNAISSPSIAGEEVEVGAHRVAEESRAGLGQRRLRGRGD